MVNFITVRAIELISLHHPKHRSRFSIMDKNFIISCNHHYRLSRRPRHLQRAIVCQRQMLPQILLATIVNQVNMVVIVSMIYILKIIKNP